MEISENRNRAFYLHWIPIQTRWLDNDVNGHVNHSVYYAFMDTAINRFLAGVGQSMSPDEWIAPFCVESRCTFKSPLAFPEDVQIGVRVVQLGKSSTTYEMGIFRAGSELASAHGTYVHVFVDKRTQKASPIPETIRTALEKIQQPPR